MEPKKLTGLLTILFIIICLPSAWSQATPTPVIGTPSAPVTPYIDGHPFVPPSGTAGYIDPSLRTEADRMAWQAEHGINIYKIPESNLFTKTGTAVRNFLAVKSRLSAEADNVETGKNLINKYKADAEQGNEEKMLYMALTYWLYLHDGQNEIIWLDKLVARNNDYAMMRRGDLFEDAKDIDNSIALYERAVKAGSIPAMTGLAEKYILYRKDEINKPVELLTAAAAKNYADACLELANLYTGGYGKQYPINYSNAISLYQKYIQLTTINTSNVDIHERSVVMKNIAMFYKNGYGVPKDNAAYRHWMKKAKSEDEKIIH